MANLRSDSIEVYPATRRDVEYQKTSRLFNEKNAIAPIQHIAEADSYIITNYDDLDSNGKFEFVIGGYYFKVDLLSAQADLLLNPELQQALNIYGYIIIDTLNSTHEIYGIDELVDENGSGSKMYTGLNISSTVPYNASHSLLLFTRNSTSEDFGIPRSSMIRFSRNTVDVDIDGGVISFGNRS